MKPIKKGLWILGCAGTLALGGYCKGRSAGYDVGYNVAQKELAEQRKTMQTLETKLIESLKKVRDTEEELKQKSYEEFIQLLASYAEKEK